MAAVLWLIKATLLTRYGLWLEWLPPALYLLLFAFSLGMIEYALDRIQRDRLLTHLTSYLPGPVAAALANQDPSDAIDATRRSITVLYADIRNFSAYCETRPPEESTAVLHAFFSLIARLVEQHGGLVESFQGDAALAVWGSGTSPPNPDKALACALALFKESRQIFPSTVPEGLIPLELGIGLETGVATVGSFGLARRRTHLAIGHPVTTAARLQEMTAELAHPILVGEGLAASLGSHQLVSMGNFLLDGLQTPVHIYAYPLRDCVE
jgi:adenylate cyclase